MTQIATPSTSKETTRAGDVLFWAGLIFAICSNEQVQAIAVLKPYLSAVATIAGIVVATYGKFGLTAARDNSVSDQEVGLRPKIQGIDPDATPADPIVLTPYDRRSL